MTHPSATPGCAEQEIAVSTPTSNNSASGPNAGGFGPSTAGVPIQPAAGYAGLPWSQAASYGTSPNTNRVRLGEHTAAKMPRREWFVLTVIALLALGILPPLRPSVGSLQTLGRVLLSGPD